MAAGRPPIPITIPRHLLHAVYRQARRAFPHECCGWLTGPRQQPGLVDSARPCANAQAEAAHAGCPDRSAHTAYAIGVPDLLALNQSLDGPSPARVLYHSHPNGRAYFSETDRRIAASPWGDGPAYPLQQLVVGVAADTVRAAALFAWSSTEHDFVEVARYRGEDI